MTLVPKTPGKRKGHFLKELPGDRLLDVLIGASIALSCVGGYWLWVWLS